MNNELKSSRPASIRTAGTLNDSEYSCQHSWKCFVNPSVNLHYHQIMIARNSKDKYETRIVFRPSSRSPSSHFSTQKKQPRNCHYRQYPDHFQTTVRKTAKNLQREYGVINKQKKGEEAGIQTSRVVVIEPQTYEMQEQQRKYLRDKFADHYQIRHKKKF